MKNSLTLFALVLASVCPAKDLKSVPASELGTTYTVIGALGRPLGTIVSCECRGITPTKDDLSLKAADWEQQVEVVSVEGQRLEKPLRIEWSSLPWAEVKKPEASGLISVVAYEDGGFVGIPSEAFDHVPAAQGDGYYFRAVLIALKKNQPDQQPDGSRQRLLLPSRVSRLAWPILKR